MSSLAKSSVISGKTKRGINGVRLENRQQLCFAFSVYSSPCSSPSPRDNYVCLVPVSRSYALFAVGMLASSLLGGGPMMGGMYGGPGKQSLSLGIVPFSGMYGGGMYGPYSGFYGKK